MTIPQETDVLIAGLGPCGLMLANELGKRGVRAVLVDPKATTAFNPQANATQARSMEHYRRHGFADEIRAIGLPPEFPTDIAYFTRLAHYELARFQLPAAKDAKAIIKSLSGSWSAAELPHRISQKYVEEVLLKHARKYATNVIAFNTRLTDFRDTGAGVEARLERTSGGERSIIRAKYLVGADGARSFVRKELGLALEGEGSRRRDFMGGRMYAIYLRCPAFYQAMPHPPAWMNVTVNPDVRAFMTAIDGKSEFAFHFQLKDGFDEESITEADAKRFVFEGWGKELPIEILSRTGWTAGYTLVANRLSKGRVFIGGDAAHLFTPAGGMGYNTAIEDAVNLGWKLAAVLRGDGGDALLDSYDTERRAVAIRNTGYARTLADSLGKFTAAPEIEQDTPAGAQARKIAGDYYNKHARAEFNIPGFTLGARYDGSPVIASDGTAPPPDGPNVYHPTACPGGRAPHMWLEDGASLYDRFGFEWTLLRMSEKGQAQTQGLVAAAQAAHVPLSILDIHHAALRDLYEADAALIRPDQIVAWRSNGPQPDATAVIARVTGRAQLAPLSH